MQAFKSILIHEIEPRQFADIYAQTIAYGMFAARLHDDTLDTFTQAGSRPTYTAKHPVFAQIISIHSRL
jgi:hypothetical protein